MIDLFSLLPQDESVKLAEDFARVYALPASSEEYRQLKSVIWLEHAYASRRMDEEWRKRDVSEYLNVMSRSIPRLRD